MQINCKRNTKSSQHGRNLKKDRGENCSIFQEHSEFNGPTFFGRRFFLNFHLVFGLSTNPSKSLLKRQLDKIKNAVSSTPLCTFYHFYLLMILKIFSKLEHKLETIMLFKTNDENLKLHTYISTYLLLHDINHF